LLGAEFTSCMADLRPRQQGDGTGKALPAESHERARKTGRKSAG